MRLRNISIAALGLAILSSPAFAGPTVSVPEPASITLLGIGIACAAWAKFGRRK